MFLAGFSACQEPDTPWDPNWNTPGNTEKPETKEPKPRYVWIDCAANFADYANDRDRIASDLARIKEVGFTDVIVDVRPTNGDVMFKSTVADPTVRIDAWHKGSYVWLERTADFDYGTKVECQNSEVKQTQTGCAVGTIMEIKDLFYNIPARLKFLKSPKTELSYITEFLQSISLVHPDISFELKFNGKLVFKTNGNLKLL